MAYIDVVANPATSGQSRIEEVGERIPSPPLPYSPLPSRTSLSFPSPPLPSPSLSPLP